MWLTFAALAQAPPAAEPPAPEPPTPEQIAKAGVDALYGKEVPLKALCVNAVELPEPFVLDPWVVGVQRGHRGCALAGVVINGAFLEPAQAYVAALDPAVVKSVAPVDRDPAAAAWTERVMLAFEQLDAGPVLTTTTKGTTVVERTYLRRDEAVAFRSVLATARVTIDPKGGLTLEETVLQQFESLLYVRPDQLEGAVTEAQVQAALTAKGQVIQQCFTDAWTRDLGLEGRVRLTWTVAAGKADGIGVIADDEPPDLLARCYARAVRPSAWPPEASGKVRWIFAVDRREVTAP